jgi:hypothetical protein
MSVWERIRTGCITCAGYWTILLLGRSLKWKVCDWEHVENVHAGGRRYIGVFWHNRILMTSYFFRNRDIVAMISRNRDGEYMARVSRRLGFGAARGSSSRGSRGAVVELLRSLRRQQDVFVTLDGPRGPRYIAKPGAAYIARKSGHPIVPFTISAEKSWTLSSWDGFIIPKPFCKALVLIGPPIEVPVDADEREMEKIREKMQASLEDLCRRGDRHWTGGRA